MKITQMTYQAIFSVTSLLLLPIFGEEQLPDPPPCGGFYDCNFYFEYFTNIDTLSECMDKCKLSCRCGHYSFNYNTSGEFAGHCYLSYTCDAPLPSVGEWVSGPKICKEHKLIGRNITYYYRPYAPDD